MIQLEELRRLCPAEETYQWICSLWKLMPENIQEECSILQAPLGQVLFYSGLDSEDVFFCLNGTLKIYKEMSDGQLYEIEDASAPTLIGETEALLNNTCAQGTVICSSTCTLLHIPAALFRQWMKSCCEALYEITVFIIQKNSRQHLKERTLLFTSGAQKLAYLLLQQYDSSDEEVVMAPIRSTMAAQTGLNARTISRCINELSSRGMLTHENRKVYITAAQAELLRQYLGELLQGA